MSKNTILIKRILGQKSLVPYILGISFLMSFLHLKVTELWLLLTLWALLISSFIFYINKKNLLVKEVIRNILLEGITLIVSLYLLSLISNSYIVFIGIMLCLFYLVISLSEKQSKRTPLVKSINSYIKISDEEKLGFNSRQKLNYTLPNSEVELAIIDGEIKLMELIAKQKKLVETINSKEKKINKLESDLNNSQSYQYVKKLKQALRQVLSERDELVKEKDHLQKEKEHIETEFNQTKLNLESQTEANNALFNEKQDLLEKLKENENDLSEKEFEKVNLLKERDQFNIQIEINKKEIEELRAKKNKLEKLEIENEDLISELEISKVTIIKVEEYKLKIDSKDKKVKHYKNKIIEKEKEQSHLLFLLKQNEEKCVTQENEIENIKKLYVKGKKKIQLKEIELQKHQKIIEESKEKLITLEADLNVKEESILELKRRLQEKEESLSKVQSTVERQRVEVFEKKEELEKLKNDIDNLTQENENHKKNIEVFQYFYINENRYLGDKELLQDELTLNEERLRNSPFHKRRFKVMYKNIEFTKRFFNEYEKLDENDKIQLEKQLLYLCYNRDKVQFRPKSPVGLKEIRFKTDQKGTGKGRIYLSIDEKQVLGISITDEKEQEHKIKQIQKAEN